MNVRSMLALGIALLVAGCGGGGGGGATVPSPQQSGGNAATQRVPISLVIPQNGSTSGNKHRAYISASALGAAIVVTQGSITVNATLDLSSGSSACTGTGSARTCTATVTVPVGTDSFTVTLYNESPAGNAIPSNAQILGIGTSTVTVSASTTGVSVYVGGEIAGFGATIPSGSLPANGDAQSAIIAIAPTDFGDNPIVAGQNDPYANPITVSITETGGSGHATLSLNGGTPATSVLVQHSNDSVTLHYDGGGSPGYAFTISLSATGVSTQNATIAPLIAGIAGTGVTSLQLNGTVTNETLAVGIAGASATYTATPGGTCTNVATFGAVSGSGASATLAVHGGSAASASGCTLTVAANGVNLVLPVVNTPVGASVDIHGTVIQEYGGYEEPSGITKGPDGNIWFTDFEAQDVDAFNPATLQNQYEYSTGQQLYGITTGSDGALWAADQSNGGVYRVTTAGVQDGYPFTGTPEGIAPGPNGLMLIADNTSGGIWTLDAGGQFTILPFSPSGIPSSVVWVPGGTLGDAWFAEGAYIGDFSLSNNTLNTEIATPDGGTASYIAYGPDGNLWVTVDGGTSPGVVIVNPSNDATTVIPIAGSSANGIVAGADGAMWICDAGNNSIDEITIAGHTLTEYALAHAGSVPEQIAVGPDGSLWFTEFGNQSIGHLIP